MTNNYDYLKQTLADHIGAYIPNPKRGIVTRKNSDEYINTMATPSEEILRSMATIRANAINMFYDLTLEQRTESLGLLGMLDQYHRDKGQLRWLSSSEKIEKLKKKLAGRKR